MAIVLHCNCIQIAIIEISIEVFSLCFEIDAFCVDKEITDFEMTIHRIMDFIF